MPRKQSRSLKKAKKGSPAAREEGKEEIVVVRGKSTPRRSPRASTASYTEKMTEPASPKTNRQTRSSRTGGKGSEPKEKPAKDDEGDVEFASSEEEVPSEEGSEYEVEEEEEDDYKPSSKRNRSARAKRGQKGKASKSPTTRKSTRTTRKRKVSEDDDDEEDDDDDDDSYRGRLRNDYKTEKTHRRQNPRRASAQKKAKSSEDDDEEEEEEGNEDDEKEEKEESEEEEEKVGARGRPQRGKAKAAAKPSKSSKDSADETATGKRTSRRQTARNVSGSATRGRSGAQRTQEAEDEGSSERDLSEEEEEERAPRRSSLRSKRKQMDASKSPKDTKEETDSAGDTSLDKPEDEGDKKQEKLINSPKQADERKSEEKDESKVKDKEEKGEEQEEEKRRADEGTGEEPSKKKAKGDAEAPEEKMEVEEVKPEEGKAAEGTADKKEGSKEEKESKSESPEKSKSTAEESPVNGSSRAADSSKDPHINTNGESCDSAEVRIHSASVGASLNRKTVSSVAANVTDAFSLVSYNVGGVSSGQHQSLLDELSQLQAAVVCLQELDGEYFEGTLSAALKDLGYASLFKAGKAMDKGLATCYKSSIFELVQHVDCEVGELLLKEVEKTDLSAEVKSVVTTYLQHPSPVLLVKLKCTASGKVVSVANFNLQSQEESIQVLHVAVVIQKLVSVSEGAANSHILCGTFNVDKDSSTIEMIKTGRLNNDRMEALKQNAIIPIPDQNKLSVASVLEQSFTHPSSLKSSYGTVLGHELDLNGKSSGGSVKSSIWFSSSSICATSVLNAERGAVANAWSPKDYHVSLKVDFGFVQ